MGITITSEILNFERTVPHLHSFSANHYKMAVLYFPIKGCTQLNFPLNLLLLPAATKLGQGNIFTSVCQEFCPQGGRVSASVHAGIHPPGSRPPDQAHTPRADPPRPGTHPPDQAHPPWEQTPPWTRHTPPPRADTPPRKQTAAYGQRAAGTHLTGMHSCLFMSCKTLFRRFFIAYKDFKGVQTLQRGWCHCTT